MPENIPDLFSEAWSICLMDVTAPATGLEEFDDKWHGNPWSP